jgi:hypothetical protein
MEKSKYMVELDTTPNVKPAIIYSIDELFAYVVEIKYKNKNYFLKKNDRPLQFGNLKDARDAAIKEKAEIAYLALSKTSEETDLSTCHADHQDRYDYSIIEL